VIKEFIIYLVGKFFGGYWLASHGCIDGHKFVCLDDFYEDVISKKCLIYSFGVNTDWSFEESISNLGCTVRTFDPTIDGSQKPKNDLITFKRVGLSHKSNENSNVGKVKIN